MGIIKILKALKIITSTKNSNTYILLNFFTCLYDGEIPILILT